MMARWVLALAVQAHLRVGTNGHAAEQFLLHREDADWGVTDTEGDGVIRTAAHPSMTTQSSAEQKDLRAPFEALARLTTGGADAPANGARVVVGVVSHPDWADARRVHRETWLRSPLVCRGSTFAAGCFLLPRFVIDDATVSSKEAFDAEQAEHGDLVLVHGSLGHKTLLWYKAAAAQFPEATFVAKMDTDTFLSPAALATSLAPLAGRSVYYGYFIAGLEQSRKEKRLQCGRGDPKSAEGEECRFADAGCCPAVGCTRAGGFSDRCFVYAQGGFYLLSRDLAHWVAEHKTLASPNVFGTDCAEPGQKCAPYTEDVQMGKWVQEAALALGLPGESLPVEGHGFAACGASCDCMHEPAVWYHLYNEHRCARKSASLTEQPPIQVAFEIVGANADLVDQTIGVMKQIKTLSKSTVHFHLLVDDAAKQAFAPRVQGREDVDFAMVDAPEIVQKMRVVQGAAEEKSKIPIPKLYTPLLLPEVEKLILLDSDVVFVKDVAGLWAEFEKFAPTDVAGMALAADGIYMLHGHLREHGAIGKKGELDGSFRGFDIAHPGFNGGVMLQDLAKMREINFTGLLEEMVVRASEANYTGEHPIPIMRLGDQSLMSEWPFAYPQHGVHVVPSAWNFQLCEGMWNHRGYPEGPGLLEQFLAMHETGGPPPSLLHGNCGPSKRFVRTVQRDPASYTTALSDFCKATSGSHYGRHVCEVMDGLTDQVTKMR